MALITSRTKKADHLIQSLLDLVDDGDLAADVPTGVALVRRLE